MPPVKAILAPLGISTSVSARRLAEMKSRLSIIAAVRALRLTLEPLRGFQVEPTCASNSSAAWSRMREHLAAFVAAYNFAKRLKTLGGLTPFQAICKAWTEAPHRFRLSPDHLTAGLNMFRYGPRGRRGFARRPFGAGS